MLGPRIMENRKPLQLKNALILYNLFQVIFSSWLFYEVSSIFERWHPDHYRMSINSSLPFISNSYNTRLSSSSVLLAAQNFHLIHHIFSFAKWFSCTYFRHPLYYKLSINHVKQTKHETSLHQTKTNPTTTSGTVRKIVSYGWMVGPIQLQMPARRLFGQPNGQSCKWTIKCRDNLFYKRCWRQLKHLGLIK